MTLRYLHIGVTAAVIAGGITIGPAYAQHRDGGLLPGDTDGMLTIAGCLLRGDQLADVGSPNTYVLANPRLGPIASVPQRTCSAAPDANAIQLDHPNVGSGRNKGPIEIDDSLLGRFVEVYGRLEKETSNDNNLREMDVWTTRVIPVEVPRVAVIEVAPEPVAAAPEPAPAPVATSGQAPADLPKTASFGPLTGLIGLFACASGLLLRSYRSRQRA